MSSVLNGRKRKRTSRRLMESAVSRLDIQAMIEDALDERHAAHKSGDCWCVDDNSLLVNRESEKRLHLKDRKGPSPVHEYEVSYDCDPLISTVTN